MVLIPAQEGVSDMRPMAEWRLLKYEQVESRKLEGQHAALTESIVYLHYIPFSPQSLPI
jgi:hypothetical protein